MLRRENNEVSIKSSNTYTFIYLTLAPILHKNSKPYVCLCEKCEISKYNKFMRFYERKIKKRESVSIIL